MPKFSLITPVHLWNQERVDKFLKTIKSVEEQTFKDFEWVVIDDGSTVPFLWNQHLIFGSQIPSVNLVQKVHEERVIALNEGFSVAKGEWWLMLDSDDELVPEALEILDDRIGPNHRGAIPALNKIFNFGCIYQHKDGGQAKRGPFKPKWLGKKHGHEVFGGGNIVSGTFLFHHSVYEKLGGFPPKELKQVDCTAINYPEHRDQEKPYIRDLYLNSPFNFAAAAQLEFPELRQFYMVDHEAEPDKIIKELGNPWGQDYYLFYKYTRKYRSVAMEEYLLRVNPR